MNLSWHYVSDADIALLAEWNHQLIREEGHRNPMTVEQLAGRMKKWMEGEYKAVVFSNDEAVGYALYKRDDESIYLRQFFVRRDKRRLGIGREAFGQLRREVWPPGVRLTVDVLCQNLGGVAFWRGVGYQDYCLTLEIMP